MAVRALWVRWSWRDLRARWVQVAALALVIAVGTGTYAALMSTSAWRRQSNNASFALLHTHDLELALTPGSTVSQGSLLALLRRLPDARGILGARERLVVPTQVEAPGGVLVPGQLVGTGTGPGPGVDTVSVYAGRGLPSAGSGPVIAGGMPAVVLERGFAQENNLPDTGTLRISGGTEVRYTGIGQSPEYFVASGSTAGGTPYLSQNIYAVLFTTLATAQQLAGAPGRVNNLVLTLRPGFTETAVAAELRAALATVVPPVSATVTTRAQMPSYVFLYQEINTDAELWRAVALLMLAGAAFAAFNLTTRIVEAQRREIGIGMAIGVRPLALAVRPLLFAAQVALCGVAFGVAVGFVVEIPVRDTYESLLPLPVWRTPFQTGTFVQAAVIGFVLPFVAAAWPVWRAVRVQPVDAIRVGHLAAKGSGLAPLLRWLPVPGRGYHQIPFRNALRTPRRTALTMGGIAAVIAVAVTVYGLLDTFHGTLADARQELLSSAPDRVSVSLDSYYPADSAAVAAVKALPAAGRVEDDLAVPSTLTTGSQSVSVVVTLLPPDAMWTPPLTGGRLAGGLVLAQKAASDLHVTVGDVVTMQHPVLAAGGLRSASTRVVVAGISPLPVRDFAYLPVSAAPMLGMAGYVDALSITPAAGYSATELEHALLDVPDVASAQGVQAILDGLQSSLNQFSEILDIASVLALILVLMIAFNTASIDTDERSREHATMLAFGLPTRTVLGMAVIESLVIGIAAAAVAVAAGYGLLSWVVATTMPTVAPDIGIITSLSARTILGALLLGSGVVAAAPLFTLRRLRRMDVPSALRVLE